MSLEDELGIPQSAITNLVRKGVISVTTINKYQCFLFYKGKIELGIKKPEAVKLTSEEFRVSTSYIYEIVQQMS